MIEATRTVNSGNACIPPAMLGPLLRRLIDRRREDDGVVERYARLSRREREVLALLADGRTAPASRAPFGSHPRPPGPTSRTYWPSSRSTPSWRRRH